MPKKHIPNILTIARIVMVPGLILIYMLLPATYWPLILFSLIAFTDFLDGYLARIWRVESAFGAFLDPAADKILVCTLLILLVAEQSTWLFTLPAIVIIFRELAMSMLREYLSKIAKADIVAVDGFGKYKTAFQMLSLAFFLIPVQSMQHPAYLCLYVSMVLTIVSLGRYLHKVQKTGLMPAFTQ
ncbi:CDP-diacylglycerol--glycerol-3-phosphate 3-phosphatidyltransferase [Rheinheimera sp.]|uniref:CDP-diacylglycerol--glycerol-3-phosphate 3-phosphatidyltransferase n=1 Tax=Rheinheimera sp. TaxID=1869214 RepID=UPI004047FE66